MMVSLKSFLHYFAQPRQPVPLSDVEKQQLQDLIQAFGGEGILLMSTPVLRVCGSR
jgi:PTS system glucose-specific IIB component